MLCLHLWRHRRHVSHPLRKIGQSFSIDRIRLCQPSDAVGELARAERIDNGNGDPRFMQHGMGKAVICAGRFHRHQIDLVFPQIADQRLDGPLAVLGSLPNCGGVDEDVQPILANVDSGECGRVSYYLFLHSRHSYEILLHLCRSIDNAWPDPACGRFVDNRRCARSRPCAGEVLRQPDCCKEPGLIKLRKMCVCNTNSSWQGGSCAPPLHPPCSWHGIRHRAFPAPLGRFRSPQTAYWRMPSPIDKARA